MSKSRIVTLTLNPAIDRSGKVRDLMPTEKLRCTDNRTDPGGGGINVARVLARLGADTLAVFPAGGLTGTLLTQLVQKENLSFEAVSVPGDTRENFNVWDVASGLQYRFVFPGPQMAASDVARCCDAALQHTGEGCYFVASGSLPPGAPPDTYANLARRVADRSGKFVLDASGETLARALDPALEIVKVNETELRGMLGLPLCDRDRYIAAARQLLSAGPKMIVVTRGKDGALLVTAEQAWEAVAPPVEAASTVGAGDSFLAALVLALTAQRNCADALRMAVAAGSAALLSEGTGLAWPEDIERLAEQVVVRTIQEPAQPCRTAAAI